MINHMNSRYKILSESHLTHVSIDYLPRELVVAMFRASLGLVMENFEFAITIDNLLSLTLEIPG